MRPVACHDASTQQRNLETDRVTMKIGSNSRATISLLFACISYALFFLLLSLCSSDGRQKEGWDSFSTRLEPLPALQRHLMPLEQFSEQNRKQPRIPRFMWFTYKENLLELPSRAPTHLYVNVLNTINEYRKFWDEPNAVVFFLDDPTCREVIELAEPRLLPHFDEEKSGAYRADICRACALYLYGGYYFDVDMLVVEPLPIGDNVSFVSPLSCGGGCFFNSFIAAAPRHVILEGALREMLDVYESGQSSVIIGPLTLFRAYSSVVDQMKPGDVHLLREFLLEENDYPELERLEDGADGWGRCDFAVDDPAVGRVYFFSRVPGAGGCLSYKDRVRPVLPTIPRRIWFPNNDDGGTMEGGENSHNNSIILETVKAYRNSWNSKYASVEFLSHRICRKTIAKVEPGLFPFFTQETSRALKDDMCKVAVLYRHGGYFFDTDLQVVEVYRPSNATSFAAAFCGGMCLSPSFVASRRRHPLLKMALKSMLRSYQNLEVTDLLGQHTLAGAYFSLSDEERSGVHLLARLESSSPGLHPEMARRGDLSFGNNFSYTIHDVRTAEVHFLSNPKVSARMTS